MNQFNTKLKNIKFTSGIKLLAAVVCIMGVLLLAFGLLKAPYFDNAFGKSEYLGSSSNVRILGEFYNYVYRTAFIYESDENVKSLKTLSAALTEYQRQIRENKNQSIESINDQYSFWIEDAKKSGREPF